MRYTNNKESLVIDKIKDLTNGMDANSLLQIFCNLIGEVIANISLAIEVPVDTCVEEFKNEVLSISKIMIKEIKNEFH